MAKPDFTQIWAATGAKTTISVSNWQQGWEYIGTGYPPRGVFNQWQYTADSRSKYLHDQINSVVTAASLTLDDVDTRLLEAIQAIAMPPGVVVPFAAISVPAGFLAANGDLVSRSTYNKLFAVIGTTYGAGDGSTTFKLPDLRGEFIRGLDSGRGIDTGRSIGTSQSDQLKSHTHNVYVEHADDFNFGAAVTGTDTSSGTREASKITATGGTETRPRNVALLYCIKY